MHHDPMEINNAARAGVVKIDNPHHEDQPALPALPAGLRWAYPGCGCLHPQINTGPRVVVRGHVVGRVCPACQLVA